MGLLRMDPLTKMGTMRDGLGGLRSKPDSIRKVPHPGCEPPFGCVINAIIDARSYSRLIIARTGYVHA